MRDSLLYSAICGDEAAFLRYEAAMMNNEFEPFTCHEIITELLRHTKPDYDFGTCTSALWLHLGIFWRYSAHWYSHAFPEQYQTLIKHAKENMETNDGIITFLLMVDTELPDDAKLLKLADYKKVVALSRAHADTNSLAQFNLAYMYLNGLNFDKEQKSNLSFERLARCGIDKDARMGYKFCKKAAEQELSIALHIIGTLQLKGIGTYVDYYGAIDTYKKAEQQGCVLTQALYGNVSDPDGLLYAVYYGEMPTSESVKWCHKAAERGYAPAQFKLATMYFDGHVVEKNIQEAYEWFFKAAEQGYAPAELTLAEAIVLAKFESIQIHHGSVHRWQQLALQKNAKALCKLGQIYISTTELSEGRFVRAIRILIEASHKGEVRAQNILTFSINRLLGLEQRECYFTAVDIIILVNEVGLLSNNDNPNSKICGFVNCHFPIDIRLLYDLYRVINYLAETHQLWHLKALLWPPFFLPVFDEVTIHEVSSIIREAENTLKLDEYFFSSYLTDLIHQDNFGVIQFTTGWINTWRWMIEYIEMRTLTPRINSFVSLESLKYLFAHNHNASSYLGILPVELLDRIACFTYSRETESAPLEDLSSKILTPEHFAIAKLQLNIVTAIKNIAEYIKTMSIKSKATKAKIETQMNMVLRDCQNIMNPANSLNKIIAQFKAPDKIDLRFVIFARNIWLGYPNYMKQFAEILQPLAGKLDDKEVLEDALEQLDALASQLKLMHQPASMPIRMARSIT